MQSADKCQRVSRWKRAVWVVPALALALAALYTMVPIDSTNRPFIEGLSQEKRLSPAWAPVELAYRMIREKNYSGFGQVCAPPLSHDGPRRHYLEHFVVGNISKPLIAWLLGDRAISITQDVSPAATELGTCTVGLEVVSENAPERRRSIGITVRRTPSGVWKIIDVAGSDLF